MCGGLYGCELRDYSSEIEKATSNSLQAAGQTNTQVAVASCHKAGLAGCVVRALISVRKQVLVELHLRSSYYFLKCGHPRILQHRSMQLERVTLRQAQAFQFGCGMSLLERETPEGGVQCHMKHCIIFHPLVSHLLSSVSHQSHRASWTTTAAPRQNEHC